MWTALLLVVLHSAPDTSDDPAPAKSAPAAEPADAGPAAIALPQISGAAGHAHRTLRSLLEPFDERHHLEEIQKELPVLAAKIEPLAGRGSSLSKQDVTDLGAALLRADETLSTWDSDLESAVKDAYAAMQELRHMSVSWARTETLAKEDEAPPVLLERIAAVRAQIQTASSRMQGRLDELLATQDKVTALRLRIDDSLAAVKQAQALEAQQLFEREGVPLWELFSKPLQPEKLRLQMAQALRLHVTTLREFTAATSGRVLFLVGTLVFLTFALWRGKGWVQTGMDADPEVASGARVLLSPFPSAVLLTLALATLLLQQRPVIVSQLILLGMLAALLAAGSTLIPQVARRSMYALAIVVAVHILSSLTPEHSLLRRILLLAVSLSAAGVLAGVFLRREWETAIKSGRARTLVRVGLMGGALLLVIAAVVNLLGNDKLAEVLTTATLGSTAVLVVLSALLAVLRGLLAILLRGPMVKRWPMVGTHAELFRTRSVRLLRWGAALLWLVFTARLFKIGTPVWDAAEKIVSYRARLGAIDLSLGDLLAFAITLWVAVVLARLVRFGLEEGLANRGLARGIPIAISRTAFYTVVATGTVLAFLASGMEVTRFAVVLGTLGVGIGFGLQNVVNNFVSGLILLYERPVQVGDVIKVGDVTGTVMRIGIRSSTVANGQGAEVIVPNGELISKEVVNWTLSDKQHRVAIDVSVASDAPTERVHALLIRVATEHPAVLRTPPPSTLLTGFKNGLNFQLLVWTDHLDWDQVASDLRAALSRALAEAEIQFPQNEMRVITVDPGVSPPPKKDGEPGTAPEPAGSRRR